MLRGMNPGVIQQSDHPFDKAQKSLMALLKLNAAAASMTFMESPKRPL